MGKGQKVTRDSLLFFFVHLYTRDSSPDRVAYLRPPNGPQPKFKLRGKTETEQVPGSTMEPFPFEFQEDDEHQEYLNLAFSPPESFDLFSPISSPQPRRQSAFVDYRTLHGGISSPSSGCQRQPSGGRNVHRRMIGFLRTVRTATRQGSFGDVSEVSKEFRHLMRERQRRERISQGYADLRCMLSTRSKVSRFHPVDVNYR